MVSFPCLNTTSSLTSCHHSCMAHVINLITQAFMGTVSTSKHYDPASPEADLVSTSDEDNHDMIGVIRAITVKVSEMDLKYSVSYNLLQAQSSVKWKEMFKSIQTCNHPLQLLLNMKVRWSSTFVMLCCTLDLKEVRDLVHPMFTCTNQSQEVNTFVVRLGSQERDSEKRCKIYELQLNDIEWEPVHHVFMLLAV